MPQNIAQQQIDPKHVVAWLVTQPNANGSLYLEHVVRSYMWALRSVPAKLDLPAEVIGKGVFSCHTPEELNQYWAVLKTAPNYQKLVSYTKIFSPGMKCFLRYLQFLQTENCENKIKSMGEETVHINHSEKKSIYSNTDNTKPHSILDGRAKIPQSLIEILSSVLQKYFRNGFIINDTIELIRFRNFTFQEVGKPISAKITDKILTQCLCACGPVFNQKIYPVSNKTLHYIYRLIEQYFSTGAQIIFYDQLYEKHEDLLYDSYIISAEMLKQLLQNHFHKFYFNTNYFGLIQENISVAVEKELIRVWGDNILHTYNSLEKLLPYIPFDRIKSSLIQSDKFILNAPDTYVNIDNIKITDTECEKFRHEITIKCKDNGYASLSDMTFDDLDEYSYELSESALFVAMFNLCLADSFDRKGKIVTHKGETLDVRTIIHNHCRQLDHCTLDELRDFAQKITGSTPPLQFLLDAANTVMVRTNKEIFVDDTLVNFDVSAIDDVIARSLSGDYAPLQTFTTFAAFPDCGQTWNLFVLESYCRRFSKQFRFDTLNVNSSSCGAIINKKNSLEYTSLLVDAVLQANIQLTEKKVGTFLTNQGYLARKSAKIKEITIAARTIRTRQM